MPLEAIKYKHGSLSILDQLCLPHQERYDEIFNAEDAFDAIKTMRTRGAPAIAIVAALGLAVELENMKLPDSAEETKGFIEKKLVYLEGSRPTAVNLADAARKLRVVVDEAIKRPNASANDIKLAYIKSAEQMLIDDVSDNKAIGRHGAEWILKNNEHSQDEVSVITHCNTGSLSTSGYGTALGIVRALHAQKALKLCICTETRPYNQGSRLTAFELVFEKIPSLLVMDSMVASLLHTKKATHNIAAIVVGADRVAANGDTANKIGTYALAIHARQHGAKFLVAAPRTTIDLQTASGRDIKIEERAASEATVVSGPVVRRDERGRMVGLDVQDVRTVSIAAEGIEVWNPAFDVTPAELIDGIVTEVGVVEKDGRGVFDLAGVFDR